jgi:hypothetical protein
MSTAPVRHRIHCVEVRGDGRIVTPVLRPDEDPPGADIPPGPVAAMLFDDPGRSFGRAILEALRGL